MLKISNVLAFLLLMNFGFAQNLSEVNIIPKPKQVALGSGSFLFDSETVFIANTEAQKEAGQVLIDRFKEATAWDLQFSTESKSANYVRFKESSAMKNEAYKLKITESGILITASGTSGFLYGVESLRQLQFKKML